MDEVMIEKHSEEYYTIRGRSIFGSEVIEYACDDYLNKNELYDKLKRRESTELTILCRLRPDEPKEDLHSRLVAAVNQRALALLANIPTSQIAIDSRD